MAKGWNPERQAFVQHYGSKYLDAANLIMPLVFFVSPSDPQNPQDPAADQPVTWNRWSCLQ
jgi:hypothetical protein